MKRTGFQGKIKPKPCAVCGEEFTGSNNFQKYCSPACANEGSLTVRTCETCGSEFKRRSDQATRFCSFRCREEKQHGTPMRTCANCKGEFQKRKAMQKYCSPSCAAQHRWKKPSKAPRSWRLKSKGEDECRNCLRPASHLHHIVPRSKSRYGREDVAGNGLPLCADCHRGWHDRKVMLYRGVLKPHELERAVELAGQWWVDKHYPLPPDVELYDSLPDDYKAKLPAGWEQRQQDRIRDARDLPKAAA